jgi:aspartyl-tRNA(Asn)/glutamyl-tRNA(Gln) amidotransferase subunit C
MDVHDVARLARLALTKEEEARLGAQLEEILRYVRQLESVDVSGVEATAHTAPLVNVARADACGPSLPRDEALKNAPATADGLFLVPRIVE